jgi:hypothetical protein
MIIPYLDISNIPFNDKEKDFRLHIGPGRIILMSDESHFKTYKTMDDIVSDIIMNNENMEHFLV